MFWNNSRTFYNLPEALGSFNFLHLRGAGTGFVVVLPLPLSFDPPLNILHFTIYTTFHREATLKTALELLDYSVKIRSKVQTITRAILPRNQSPSVSNSQRGRSCEQIFDSSTTFLNPLVGTNSLYGKRTVGFFSLASHALRACKARVRRVQDSYATLYWFLYWFWEKNRLFCSLILPWQHWIKICAPLRKQTSD